ncbi:MAG: GatB/YqeY domain-containing protein [Ardenticatenaceae bacterium]|nr:GatB/YqeY domain-containing protein [Ardenticatenaceae bacterium]
MSLKEQLRNDMADAMRSKDTGRRDVLRMMIAAVKQTEVDGGQELDDDGVLAVLAKQAKQRRESISDSEKAGRPDLAAQEQAELVIIEAYLPQKMSREEVEVVARQVIAELGVSDVKGMGRVMGQMMARLKDQADGQVVSQVVRELLQNG